MISAEYAAHELYRDKRPFLAVSVARYSILSMGRRRPIIHAEQ